MPTVEAWSEAAELITKIIERDEQEDLRQRCWVWWNAYKTEIKHVFRQRLLASEPSENFGSALRTGSAESALGQPGLSRPAPPSVALRDGSTERDEDRAET
jgi:hypothetical protein